MGALVRVQLGYPGGDTDEDKTICRKALDDVANAAKPDTIMGWYRRLVARKFDGSKSRRYPGRPRINEEIEEWVVRMAKENSDWGYDQIVGAMANLGYRLSDKTVGDILQRHGIPPAPERKRTTTWTEFIRAHMAVLAGTDFFSVEVLTLRGLVTHYVQRALNAAAPSRSLPVSKIRIKKILNHLDEKAAVTETIRLPECRAPPQPGEFDLG